MNREQFFQELRTALHREGFTPQPEQDELLPVEWDGLPLCRITADGGVRYWQEDVATPERERACERATDLACTVREYMTLLEQAPPLQAQSLTGDYRLLADFNSDTLDTGFDLTAEQEKCIRGVQEQIAIAAPDALERIREQEQHPMEPYNQEPIM